MVRGIERRDIFADTKDKQSFLQRLCSVLTATQTTCYAYALMSNHYHLLQIQPKDLSIRGQKNAASQGRALLSKWMAEGLGEPKAAIAEQLGVSRPAMTKLVRRGKEVEKELGVFLGMED